MIKTKIYSVVLIVLYCLGIGATLWAADVSWRLDPIPEFTGQWTTLNVSVPYPCEKVEVHYSGSTQIAVIAGSRNWVCRLIYPRDCELSFTIYPKINSPIEAARSFFLELGQKLIPSIKAPTNAPTTYLVDYKVPHISDFKIDWYSSRVRRAEFFYLAVSAPYELYKGTAVLSSELRFGLTPGRWRQKTRIPLDYPLGKHLGKVYLKPARDPNRSSFKMFNYYVSAELPTLDAQRMEVRLPAELDSYSNAELLPTGTVGAEDDIPIYLEDNSLANSTFPVNLESIVLPSQFSLYANTQSAIAGQLHDAPIWIPPEKWLPLTNLDWIEPKSSMEDLILEQEIIPYVASEPQSPVPLTVEEVITQDISVTYEGIKSYTIRQRILSGTKSGFVSGFTREELFQLKIDGRVRDWRLEANVYQSSTDLENNNRANIELSNERWNIYLGSFVASIANNEFALFNKKLDGVQVKYQAGALSGMLVASIPQGYQQKDTFYGNGTQGPYALNNSPLVVGSEMVYRDGQLLQKEIDYNLDYESGEITFLRNIIDQNTFIEVNYEYRATLFPHSLYGIRLQWAPSEDYKIGGSFISDSDSLEGAEAIAAAVTADPVVHYLIGLDGDYQLAQNINFHGESAVSYYDGSALDGQAGTIGKAIKGVLHGDWDTIKLNTAIKQVGSLHSIGNSNLQEGLLALAVDSQYLPTDSLSIKGALDYEFYPASGYNNYSDVRQIQLSWLPVTSSRTDYQYYQQYNDSGGQYSRRFTSHRWSGAQELGETILKGGISLESVEDYLSASQNYSAVAGNLGGALLHSELADVNTDAEIQSRHYATGADSMRTQYALQSSLHPESNIALDNALRWINDSVDGQTTVMDLQYKLTPWSLLSTTGKYTIESLSETVGAVAEPVFRHNASLKFKSTPWRGLVLNYQYQPRFTELKEHAYLRSDDRLVQQTELTWQLLRGFSASSKYKRSDSTQLDTDDPSVARQESQDYADTAIYQIQCSPLSQADIVMRYQRDGSVESDLQTTTPAVTYETGLGDIRKYTLEWKHSLSTGLSLETAYTVELESALYPQTPSDDTDSQSNQISLSGYWRANSALTAKLTGAYQLEKDYSGGDPDTYSYTPKLELNYTPDSTLRLRGVYYYTRSITGTPTDLQNFSGSVNWEKQFELVLFTLSVQLDWEKLEDPYYETWDLLTKGSLVF